MKKKEIIKRLSPYWVEYCKNNGELERKLQMEKFVNSFERMKKFSFYALFHFGQYLAFRFSNFQLRRSFWRLSETLAKMHKFDEELGITEKQFKEEFSASELEDIKEKRKVFKESLNVYFERTLGATEREVRLWSAWEVFQSLGQ